MEPTPKPEVVIPGPIQKRKSYHEFDRLAALLDMGERVPVILRYLHQVLDERGAYGSRAASEKAIESLEQVLKDREARLRKTIEEGTIEVL